jgi:RNA ligase (TIGR02306 family)
MDWKVSKEQIKLFPHPNAEKLELGRLGDFQVVVQKGLYKDGDTVIFLPDKSVLPDAIAGQGDMRKYLVGEFKNRIKAVKLRQELSCGMILPDSPEFAEIPVGQDISEKLGIVKYEPPVPAQLRGKIRPMGNIDTGGAKITRHDCYQFGVFADQLDPNEEILVTEKIHGSQIICIRTRDGRRLIASKGLLGRAWTIDEDEKNTYWAAAKNTGIFDILDEYWPNIHVQAFGEVVPVQKGFTYNRARPIAFFFRIDVEGKMVPPKEILEDESKAKLTNQWVPIFGYYQGVNKDMLYALRSGKERVSGKELHIREGIVIQPTVPKLDDKGNHYLMLKLINPEYKETGEEIN